MRRRFKRWLREHLLPPPTVPDAPIWSKGIATACDWHGSPRYPFLHTESVQNPLFFRRYYGQAAGLVWLRLSTRARAGATCDLDLFARHALPQIRAPFVLITTDGAISVPGDLAPDTVARLFASPWLVAWRSQNHDGSGEARLGPFPIGLDLHTPRPEGGPQALVDLLAEIAAAREPASQAPLRVFSDLALNLNSPARAAAVAALGDAPHVEWQRQRISQRAIWERYASAPFVLSAFGVGRDCHRTYEALCLGSIVLTQHSSLDPLYEGLPVALLHDWRQARDLDWLAAQRARLAPLTGSANIARRLHPAHWLAPLAAQLAAARGGSR